VNRPPRKSARPEPRKNNGTPFESVALLLQGGGALGAYQAGVYEALVEAGIEPTWVAGISIGAINSAIIAGNPPEERVEKLRTFWDSVTAGPVGWPGWMPFLSQEPAIRGMANQFAASSVMAGGVPGFFKPRMPPPPFQVSGTPGAISWYDTSMLKSTLERLVDFDRINARETRFSVGAVNVRTGNFAYFDNATDTIRPEHVMASGALPPAFAPVEIDGEFYWDGGMVSNTPLDWVLSARSNLDTLIFQVDLWSAKGEMPRDMACVATRMKDIHFSSRTRAATDSFKASQKLRAAFHDLLKQMPTDLAATPEAQLLAQASDPAVYNIVQLIYHSPTYERESKDYEFSRSTMSDHWRSGYENACTTLVQPEVLTPPSEAAGIAIYDFLTPSSVRPTAAKSPKDLT
jgi:NTE family protein